MLAYGRGKCTRPALDEEYHSLSPNSLPVDRAFTVRGSHLSFNLPRRAGPGATPRPLSRFDRHSHASHVEL